MGLLASNFINWFCEPIAERLFDALDVIEKLFMGLAGISSKTTAQSGRAENVVITLLQGDTTKKLMTSLMLFGICVLILCVILAIVRNVYKEDSKVTISSIIGQAIKAVIGFILVPALCLVGVMFSNIILQAIAGVTSAGGNMGNSFSSGIYDACSIGEEGSIFLDYTSDMTDENLDEIIKSFKDDVDVKDDETQTSMEFATIIYAQYLYNVLTRNYYYYYNDPNGDDYEYNGGYLTSANLVIVSYQTSGPLPGTNLENMDFIDMLGIKKATDECRYFTPSVMNNGNGNPNFIDTPEDVVAFYNVLYSQYRANFPNAVKAISKGSWEGQSVDELIQISLEKSTTFPTIKILCYDNNNYFGAPKVEVFAYYYHGKCIYDSNADMTETTESGLTMGDRGFRLLKGAYNALVASGRFDSVDNGAGHNMRFEFKNSDNSLTNAQLRGSIGIGVAKIDYFYACLASILIFKSLFFLCFGLAKRIAQLLTYYVLSPIALALYPFDNGRAFVSWKNDFIGYVVGAYGAVAGMNISIQLVGIILNNLNIFNSGTLNSLARLIMYIVLAQGVEQLVKLLSGWIGAKDLLAEGKATSNTATAPIKKVAGSVMRVAGTAIGTGVGVLIGASAARKNRVTLDTLNSKLSDKDMSGKAKSAAQAEKDRMEAEETAKAAGYSSASAYAADLAKNASNGNAWYKGGGLGTALRNTAKAKANQVGSFAANKFASTQFGMAFDKETGLSGLLSQGVAETTTQKVKADLNAKLSQDFKDGVVTAKMSADLTKELQDIKESINRTSRANSSALTTFAGQLTGIKGLSTTDAEEFLRTGNMSLISGLSNKAQQMAIQTRSNYLTSDDYQDYAQSLRAARAFGYDESTITGSSFDPATEIESIISKMRSKLDLATFQTAQKEGNEQEMRRLIASATGNSNPQMLEELFKRLSATTASAAETISKSAKEAGEKAAKRSDSYWKGSAPKK